MIPGFGTRKVYADNASAGQAEESSEYETKEGFIWIGGYSGLIRYDGNNFERQDSTVGLTSINVLYEDTKGRLWVGTNDNGIVCIEKDNSNRYSYDEGLDSSSITGITEDNNGNIIVGTKQGLFYFYENLNIGEVGGFQNLNLYQRS